MNVVQPRQAWLLAVSMAAIGCGADAPTANPSLWAGRTYLATPADPYSYLTQPSQSTVAKQMAKFIPNFLLKVRAASASKVELTVAPAKRQPEQPGQDFCNVTVEASASVTTYPHVQIGPLDFPLYLTNSPANSTATTAHATVRGFTLSDLLPNGAVVSESGKMSALVDARDIYRLVTALDAQSAQEVCDAMLDSYQIQCVPCPDSQVLCLSFEAEGFGAVETDIEVKTVRESDLEPSCPKP